MQLFPLDIVEFKSDIQVQKVRFEKYIVLIIFKMRKIASS